MLFSSLVPIIPVFAAFFFWIKYYVDKYNLIFVYFKVYESGGKIRKNVTLYMTFTLGFYLVITVSFFSAQFSQEYLYGGSIMFATWSIIYYYTKQQLMSEFNLDKDLTKKSKIRSAEVISRSVLRNFKQQQKKRMGNKQAATEAETSQNAKNHQDFKRKMGKIILFNERALRRAYLHPFQRVNKKLYQDQQNTISTKLTNQMTSMYRKGGLVDVNDRESIKGRNTSGTMPIKVTKR